MPQGILNSGIAGAAETQKFPYFINRWSYEAGLPLILSGRLDLVGVIHRTQTPQTTGSGLKRELR